MSWEPTTRGTRPNKKACHEILCLDQNADTSHYVVDGEGRRYFCTKHWADVCAFMRDVRFCVNCKRNHLADYYERDRTALTLKFQDKWWELCWMHFTKHNNSMSDIIFED